MQKMPALIFLSIILISFTSCAFADELTLKASGSGQWTIYNSAGQDIGTLAKVGQGDPIESEAGGYSILPKSGQYLGVIRSDGVLQLTVRHATISPSEARLYLDVLEAMKTLK
jgi:hypothetical protein